MYLKFNLNYKKLSCFCLFKFVKSFSLGGENIEKFTPQRFNNIDNNVGTYIL